MPCGRCAKPVNVYECVYFIEQVLSRYAAALKKIQQLTEAPTAQATPKSPSPATVTRTVPMGKKGLCRLLPSEKQHAPLQAWFQARKVTAHFDYQNVNMEGYFDEAADQIGQHFSIMADVLGKIGWSYRKSHSGLNIDLSKMAQKDIGPITSLCRNWYNNALFAKYLYQKNEKIIRIGLQSASPARQFFSGGWLEWFALNRVIETFGVPAQKPFACTRGVKIQFENEDTQEIDVAALLGNQLLAIECKTGEFRNDIDKLSRLQKRLGLAPAHFIVCASSLDDAQATSLSHMYGMTFVSLPMLAPYLQNIAASH